MMSEIFWMFTITSGIGFLLAVARMCYKSKCSEINFGCIKIVRNIEAEEENDQLEMNRTRQATQP